MHVSVIPQELIYKEFFSQGDLVRLSSRMLSGDIEHLAELYVIIQISELIPHVCAMCACCLCAGESHGEQAEWDDGQRESIYPRTTDQLHGAYRHAHLQVCTNLTPSALMNNFRAHFGFSYTHSVLAFFQRICYFDVFVIHSFQKLFPALLTFCDRLVQKK